MQRAERDRDENENLKKLRTKELRARLASLGLKTTGRKIELRARLQAAMDENDKKDVRECRRGTRGVHQDLMCWFDIELQRRRRYIRVVQWR